MLCIDYCNSLFCWSPQCAPVPSAIILNASVKTYCPSHNSPRSLQWTATFALSDCLRQSKVCSSSCTDLAPNCHSDSIRRPTSTASLRLLHSSVFGLPWLVCSSCENGHSPVPCFLLVLALLCIQLPVLLIHSFIPAVSITPLQVLYYSEALPTTARILYQSFTLKRTILIESSCYIPLVIFSIYYIFCLLYAPMTN